MRRAFGRAIFQDGQLARIVVRDVKLAGDSDYLLQSNIEARLRPEFVAEVTHRARRNRESIVFVHSHPFPLNEFSAIDDAGETILSDFLERRMPGEVHAALLITPEAAIARLLGRKQSLEVIGVGANIVWGQNDSSPSDDPRFDRQMRVFGSVGQRRLKRLRVGIVGLGGTGSIVLEQLAHLGIGRFLLIDPDVVEQANLNRLVGASFLDVGKPKVAVAAAQLSRINPSASTVTRTASVLLSKVAEELTDTDLVFCCTDSQGSRAVLNQLAYQYLVPVIDMGVAIVASGSRITRIVGRVQMLAPGLGCLVCGHLLNPEAVRVDLMTEFERNADPYVIGFHEPAPAVISLNATVASMAVTMFLSAAAGVPSVPRLINYNAVNGSTRAAAIKCHPTCIVCSTRGALARCSEWPLPARQV